MFNYEVMSILQHYVPSSYPASAHWPSYISLKCPEIHILN